MTRDEFHRLYENTPEDFRAELIGGIVYVSSPVRLPHGASHPLLTTVFTVYGGNTTGVQVVDNTTVLLGEHAEPQPDLFLRILPEYGGQTRTTPDQYVEGAPELVAEIAHSSRAIDLHAKADDYARYGVLEYLVLSIGDRRLRWFDLAADQELAAEPDGIVRIRCFPGLWIYSEALFSSDFHALMGALQQGMSAPEHAAFVAKLAEARQRQQGI